MKWSFTSVGLIMFGIIGAAIIILFQNLTTNNENDYYLLKEVTEASIFDAIDYKAYRETGQLKIKEKVFVESFTRRFAESTLFDGSSYTIKMFDIMESPPKVTILIDNGIGKYTIYDDTSDYNVVNSLSGILEYNNSKIINVKDNSMFYIGNEGGLGENSKSSITGSYHSKMYERDYYSFIGINNGNDINFKQILKVPDVLDVQGGLIKIVGANVLEGPSIVSDNFNENVLNALLKREIDWSLSENGETNYFNYDFYNGDNYFFGNLNVLDINDIKLCDIGFDTRCNGTNTFAFSWKGNIDNNGKKILFVKYKIGWHYEIFE